MKFLKSLVGTVAAGLIIVGLVLILAPLANAQAFSTGISWVRTGHLVYSQAAPTIASGFGTSASVPANNGTSAFTVNVGTGGSATAGVITMPTATTGWICHVNNLTAELGNVADSQTIQIATSTTSVTVESQTVSTGVVLAWTASDILQLSCAAYEFSRALDFGLRRYKVMAIAGVLTYPPPSFAWGKDVRGMSSRTVAKYTGATAGAGGYVTGGDAIAAGDVKLGVIEYSPAAVAIATTGAATAVVFQYNLVTGKLQAFWQTGAAAAAALPEVTSGTDLSDYSALIEFQGRG